MILQRDPRLRVEIQRWGCYLCVLLFLANKYTNYQLSVEAINRLYQLFVAEGCMGGDCYIYAPQRIMDLLQVPVRYTDRIESPDRAAGPGELEVLRFRLERPSVDPWVHFVAGDGAGHVAYDPWGVSRAAVEGALESKRIFRWVA